MVESRSVRILLRVLTFAILAFLYLPLMLVAISAFNDGPFMAWPPPGLSTQ